MKKKNLVNIYKMTIQRHRSNNENETVMYEEE